MSLDVPPGVWFVPAKKCRGDAGANKNTGWCKDVRCDVHRQHYGQNVGGGEKVRNSTGSDMVEGAPKPKSIPVPKFLSSSNHISMTMGPQRVEGVLAPVISATDRVHDVHHLQKRRRIQYRPAGPAKSSSTSQSLFSPMQHECRTTLWVPEADSLCKFLLEQLQVVGLNVGMYTLSAAVKECAELLHASGVGISDVGQFQLLSRRLDADAGFDRFLVFESNLLKTRCGRQAPREAWDGPRFFAIAVNAKQFCATVSDGEVVPVRFHKMFGYQGFPAKGCLLDPNDKFRISSVLGDVARDLQNKVRCLILGTCWGTRAPKRGAVLSHDQVSQRFWVHADFYQLNGFALKLD